MIQNQVNIFKEKLLQSHHFAIAALSGGGRNFLVRATPQMISETCH